MNIQWYPGHMVKTKKEIKESLKLIDAVLEILDSRIPESSKNPDIDELIENKPKIILLNKCDLAEDAVTKKWIAYFKKCGIPAVEIDSISGKNIDKIYPLVKDAVKEKFEKKAAKGITGRPVRALVAGIPNVGKSSFINRISSKTNAKTGDKPGVTKSRQWIKVNNGFELLDTPGILWPKFDDEKAALHLAYTRAIKDEIIDAEEIAYYFIKEVSSIKPDAISSRYGVEVSDDASLTIEAIGRKRGCIISGGKIDTQRVSNLILDEYRSKKLGRISLEVPGEV